jgi:hypothetical protein
MNVVTVYDKVSHRGGVWGGGMHQSSYSSTYEAEFGLLKVFVDKP